MDRIDVRRHLRVIRNAPLPVEPVIDYTQEIDYEAAEFLDQQVEAQRSVVAGLHPDSVLGVAALAAEFDSWNAPALAFVLALAIRRLASGDLT